MFRRSVMVLGVLSFLLSFVGHGAWGGVQYTVTDLGTLSGGSLSAASGINAIGQVVGASYTSSGLYHAFLYSNGAMTDLGTLGGTWSGVGDINASGQVVGGAVTNGGDYHAFLYSNATMADLNTLASNLGGWTLNGAGGINASGQVCGVMSSVIDDEVVPRTDKARRKAKALFSVSRTSHPEARARKAENPQRVSTVCLTDRPIFRSRRAR